MSVLEMNWDPRQYLKFGNERLRPALDLVARVDIDAPSNIVDLGCGTGAVTSVLQRRWPDAAIVGVDNSQPMLERARAALPEVHWELADLATWKPASPPDLILSNAALQWADDHYSLFVKLLGYLREGGVFAVQMPAQHAAPSHRIGFELAQSERWRDKLQHLVRSRPVLDPEDYHTLLSPHASSIDIWTTEYFQVLTGENPVAEFTKGSFVGTWLAALSPEDASEFEAEYRRQVASAYRPMGDGTTLFPFRRLFLVARC